MKSHIRFTAAAIILCAAIVFLYAHIFAVSEGTRTSDKEFSTRISNWTSEEVFYDKELLKALSPDRVIYRNYNDARFGSQITLFMAYYNTLEKADLSHSPIVCFTGQGWHIDELTKKAVLIEQPHAHEIEVNQMIQTKLDTTMITLFWYQTANRAIPNRGIQKLSLFLDKLLGKQDNNAFVRLTLIVPSNKSVEETRVHLFSFVRVLYPELTKFFL